VWAARGESINNIAGPAGIEFKKKSGAMNARQLFR
jgi:hypothetical protein